MNTFDLPVITVKSLDGAGCPSCQAKTGSSTQVFNVSKLPAKFQDCKFVYCHKCSKCGQLILVADIIPVGQERALNEAVAQVFAQQL